MIYCAIVTSMGVLLALLQGQGQLVFLFCFLLRQLLHYSSQLESQPVCVFIFPLIILMQTAFWENMSSTYRGLILDSNWSMLLHVPFPLQFPCPWTMANVQ